MTTISVIVPNWNGAALLDDCIGSLKRQTFRDFELIVVDDGSTDDSVERVSVLDAEARVVRLQVNRGFAAAANAGIAAARGDLLLILNNDTELDSECLGEVVAAAERAPNAGMIAPKILNFYRRREIDSVGGLMLTFDAVGNGRGRGEIDDLQLDSDDVFFPSGCAAVYRKAMLDEIGAFAEDFFAYCEDADLGLRARWAGWTAVGAPKAIVYHKYSQTTGAGAPHKLYLVERNRIAVAVRNYPLWVWPLVFGASPWRYAVMAYAAMLGRGRGEAMVGASGRSLAMAMLQGWRDALLSAPRQFANRTRLRRISTWSFLHLLRKHHLPVTRLILTR